MTSRRPLSILWHPGLVLTAVASLALSSAACQRSQRCGTCGMKVDPASPWVSYLTVGSDEQGFDTPGCAITAWRRSKGAARHARFREYYSQEFRPAEELRFVAGSDVIGPMGPDVVPVLASSASRFARDHNGAPPKSSAELVQGMTPPREGTGGDGASGEHAGGTARDGASGEDAGDDERGAP